MRIGIEIEIENINELPGGVSVRRSGNDSEDPIPAGIPGVNQVIDGSLRNGIELVSDPLPDVPFATNLYKYIFDNISGNYSERCGLHVHMEVGSSRNKLKRFVETYLKAERTMFRIYPELFRSNNNFCRLLSDSTHELNVIRSVFPSSSSSSTSLFNEYSKYTALNLKPLVRLGTVEFRACYAGLSPDQFNKVMDILSALYEGNIPEEIASQITEQDRVEAEAAIHLFNTPHNQPSGIGPYMQQHFPQTAPIQTELTVENIRQVIRGL